MANLLTGVSMDYSGDVSGKVFYSPLFRNPAIQRFFTLLDGIQSRTNLPVAGAMQKITKKDPGCGLTETGTGISIAERTITPEKMVSHLQHCPRVFDNTLFEKLRRKGVDLNNIEGTDIEQMILKIVTGGLTDDLFRQVFFGNTASADADYSAYNGVWKQLFAGVTAGNVIRTSTIGSAALSAGDAKDILRSVVRSAPNVLRQLPKSKAVLLVTGSVYDNLLDTKLDIPNLGSSALEILENGAGEDTEYEYQLFEGYRVIAMRSWDTWIDDLSETTPHRTVLWAPDNHFIATDTSAAFNQVKVWYSNDDDQNKTLARYMIGYNYALPQMISLAY
ncbi:MAG: hypothetical protein SGJ04_02240 [Bacteroidota bacterium]|nr:hypothetical protein [Bacteroidota bacterium]